MSSSHISDPVARVYERWGQHEDLDPLVRSPRAASATKCGISRTIMYPNDNITADGMPDPAGPRLAQPHLRHPDRVYVHYRLDGIR